MKTLDRYVIREILPPLAISLVVLTFVLLIPPILREAEALIAKGVEWSVVGRVLLTLLPQALGITIPMSVLLGILIGFGRLSADREFVALQACGVSLYRLARPVAIVALAAVAADAYEMIVALPDGNQTFREITFNVVANRAQTSVKPRVFFSDFPNRVLYVRDVLPDGNWRDVFLADASRPDQTTVFLARSGALVIDREKRLVMLALSSGSRHTVVGSKPDEYEGGPFASLVLNLDADTVFPRTPPAKGMTEMSIAELRRAIRDDAAHGGAGSNPRFMIQQKFSIPAASLVLALIGLALGMSHRKDGRLASFSLGFAVIFVYYVLLWTARAAAISGRFNPELAPWMPNLALGIVGVWLLVRRARSADRPLTIRVPALWPRGAVVAPAVGAPSLPRGQRVVLVVRVPRLDLRRLPRPRLLDLYVAGQYLKIFGLGVASLLGIFYISTFMDMADKLFRGSATTGMLLRYFWFLTPQYTYYVIPMSVLVSTLVTVGLMTKNSELVVIKACGVSLYRVAAPLVLFACAASGLLFGLEEKVLAHTNKEAERLNRVMRGLPAQSFGALDRRWAVGRNGDLYHYDFFDPRRNEFVQWTAYQLDPAEFRVRVLTRAARVRLAQAPAGAAETDAAWTATNGWTRTFTDGAQRAKVTYTPFVATDLTFEPPGYFKAEDPQAGMMTYGQLQSYIGGLRARGYSAAPFVVALQRRIAFPFVTLVMTLLAVPFAVTTGRRGALYGVGVGIVLAVTYWTTLSVFAAMGTGGLLSPLLAAWAPNILFGAGAVYLLLTVRT